MRRERRGPIRPNGSAQLLRRARTTFRNSTVVAGHSRWLAIAVVAGLFAMHGLGMHGAHSAGASSAMHSESISSASGMSAPGMPPAGHDDGANGESSDPSSGAGLLGLCLTLLAFGVLWLRRWASGRPAWTIRRRALAARVAQLPTTARDLRPPLRAELSIWRC